MLKKTLAGLLSLVVVLAIVGAFLPKTVTVTRSTIIQAPPSVLYPLVATPRLWPQWFPWNGRDPGMTVNYSGPETGTGATGSWQSRTEGNGSMTVAATKLPRSIGYTLTLERVGPPSTGRFLLDRAGDRTIVTWSLSARMGYGPLGGWLGLYVPGTLTRDFDVGLANLKRLAEMPSAPEPAPRPQG